MSQEQRNLEFRQIADSFINVANEHCENLESARVGSSMMYACARFSSFVVASHSKDQDQFESEIENAVQFFSDEFKRMLVDNMEEYKNAFSSDQESTKYEHLMKKEQE